ncbi:MAG: hypothetical protein L3J20_07340 [Flavobacteriaceae bacterium]|nr:hypothetical protein [Flavobacteriaceae bacterium]
MKKLSILLAFAVLSLVSTIAFAQETQDKVEVQISELPEVVTKVLEKQFVGYAVDKAYKTVQNEKEVYYVKLLNGEEYIKVLIDAEGNIIEKEQKTEKPKK